MSSHGLNFGGDFILKKVHLIEDNPISKWVPYDKLSVFKIVSHSVLIYELNNAVLLKHCTLQVA